MDLQEQDSEEAMKPMEGKRRETLRIFHTEGIPGWQSAYGA